MDTIKKIKEFLFRYYVLVKNKHIYVLKSLIRDKELRKAKRLYLIGTPEHGNLGDHAIAIAIKQYVHKNTHFEFREIPFDLYIRNKDKIISLIHKDDLIAIMGGGFMGSLWQADNNLIKNIIVNFPENKIVIFPQTVYYKSIENLYQDHAIYTSHGNIHIMTRDALSLDICKTKLLKNAPERCHLVPDMALYLKYNKKKVGKNVILCLRDDKESLLTKDFKKHISDVLLENNLRIKQISTVLKQPLGTYSREKKLNKILDSFASSQLVITDRLHAMIFCAITGTPCIVFDNISKKISGIYSCWMKSVNYIFFAESTDDIQDNLSRILYKTDNVWDHFDFCNNFDIIKEILSA